MNKSVAGKFAKQALGWFGMIVAAFVLFGVFLLAQGANPIDVYVNMFTGTFNNEIGVCKLILKSVPFIMLAVATCISTRAGLVNVGAEGQFMMGMLFCTTAGLFLFDTFPNALGLVFMALTGMLGGTLYGGIAGVLKIKAKMNETITTVVMNYISYYIISIAVYGYLKDPEGHNWPMSSKLGANLSLPTVYRTVNIGIIIALIVAAVTWFVFEKTKAGYKLKVVCGNPKAAEHAGINVNRIKMLAMLATGAVSGLAGMIEMCGVEGRLRTTTGQNYGYLGFLAAWMAWNNPVLAIVTSVIIAFLSVSGNVLEFQNGLPASCTQILMSVVLLTIMWRGKGGKKA